MSAYSGISFVAVVIITRRISHQVFNWNSSKTTELFMYNYAGNQNIKEDGYIWNCHKEDGYIWNCHNP